MAGRDIQENQFVGALLLITSRHSNRISRVAQVDEIRPLHNSAPIDVQARYDTFGEHAEIRSVDAHTDTQLHHTGWAAHSVIGQVSTLKGAATRVKNVTYYHAQTCVSDRRSRIRFCPFSGLGLPARTTGYPPSSTPFEPLPGIASCRRSDSLDSPRTQATSNHPPGN